MKNFNQGCVRTIRLDVPSAWDDFFLLDGDVGVFHMEMLGGRTESTAVSLLIW